MRFRTGVIIGLAVGYYLGARAGRERYEELEAYLDRVRSTDAYQQARERVLDLVDGGIVQARTALEDAVPGLRELGEDGAAGDLGYDEDLFPGRWTDTSAS